MIIISKLREQLHAQAAQEAEAEKLFVAQEETRHQRTAMKLNASPFGGGGRGTVRLVGAVC